MVPRTQPGRRGELWPASQSLFDFLSRGAASLSRDFRSIGDDSALSSRGVKVLSDVIERLGAKEDRTAAESKLLAKALRETGDAADRAAAKAVLADAAIGRLGEQMKNAEQKSSGLNKALGNLKPNPGLVGPILALVPALGTLTGVVAGVGVGLAGAFVAGGGALAAFGAVAKPVLTDAKTAATAVEKAQNNYAIAIANGTKQSVAYRAEQIAIAKAYANLSPAQIALSQQLGAMAKSWDAVKTAQTPVVAGALQPWLRSVTDLTRNLAPIIAAVAPVIKGLGTQFDALVNSAAFRGFRDFIAGTGSKVVGAAGGTIIDLVKSFMILLPKFNPLILQMTGGIAAIGPAVLKWASSQKTADQITAFMGWFTKNGPVVGGLLTNIGGALKALAPGLTAGGAAELQIISGFFGLIAKLPPAFAKPVTEVAGALLILSKLGVLKVGIQIVGAAAKWLTGGLVNLGGGAAAGAEIRAAMVSGGAAAAAEIRAAMAGGGAAGGAAGAAKAAAPGAALGGLSLGAFAGLAAGGAAIGAGFILAVKKAIESGWKGILGILPGLFGGVGGILNVSATGWANIIVDRFAKPVRQQWDNLGHFLASSFDVTRHQIAAAVTGMGNQVAGSFDQTRHQVAATWNALWANVRSVVSAGVAWVAGAWRTLQSGVVSAYNTVRTEIAGAWNTIWANTRNAVTTGISNVVGFFRGLPGKITGILGNAGSLLTGWGKGVITGLLSGITSVWQSVVSFFAGVSKAILHALGIKSPPQWAIDAGKHIMNGIGIGVSFAKGVVSKATAAQIQQAAAGALNVPGGGPVGGDAAANKALARSMFPWPASQWPAFDTLEMHEAGYNRFARNPSSGAYGIPQCYSTDMMILTRRGWLKHDEVCVGDETVGYNAETGYSEWTKITAVLHPGVHRVVRYGNSHVEFTTTPNHRWLMSHRRLASDPRTEAFVEIQERATRHTLILAKEHRAEHGLPITLDEAALLGWIAGDGWERKAYPKYGTGRRGGSPATFHICQTKQENWPHIERAVAGHGKVVRTRERTVRGEPRLDREWRLSAPYARDLAERAGHPKADHRAMILAMSSAQRKAWLDAMFLAEGSTDPRDGHRSISQNDGALAETIRLAIYLEGYRPSVCKRADKRYGTVSLAIGFAMPTLVVKNPGFFYEDAGEQEVWCVTTELGSFTAEQNGHIHLTGNSLPPTKMPFAAQAAGGSHAGPQLAWMFSYIRSVYGDPATAWARYYQHPGGVGWYGGGLDAMFSRPTLIGVGERGPEHVQVTPGGGGDLGGKLDRLSGQLAELIRTTAAVPAATGRHVAAGVNGASADAVFRGRYPGR